MKYLLFFLLIFLIFDNVSKKYVVGRMDSTDKWQSEFSIKIKKDGSASSSYGSGEIGEWKLTDGNLTIFWNSGKTDYFFNGVMGYQRIRKNKNESYTSVLENHLTNLRLGFFK